MRFEAWARNQHSLEVARRANPHARFAADWTADWTHDELAGLRGGPLKTTGAEEQQPFDDAAVGDAGPIDWVRLGAVNAPVSQGRCGTCAQFSATADIEAQWFLHGHGLVKLSEQDSRSSDHLGIGSGPQFPFSGRAWRLSVARHFQGNAAVAAWQNASVCG